MASDKFINFETLQENKPANFKVCALLSWKASLRGDKVSSCKYFYASSWIIRNPNALSIVWNLKLEFRTNFASAYARLLQGIRGVLTQRIMRKLNVADAAHFYNLASLEATLQCLMHVTAR